MFGNPVAGTIRPPGSPAIFGSFRVTATFAEHVAGGRGPGIDIGNMRCGDPIFAMADGRVTFSDLIGAAKVVRILHAGGYESGYAHLATIETKKGLTVVKGQRIGTLGTTGADACHLHGGVKLNGVEIDWWGLLDQNQETDVLQGTNPRPTINRQVKTLANGTRFRAAPSTTAPILVQIAAGGTFYPDFLVDGDIVNGTPGWYAGFGVTPKGRELGYLHESVVTAPVPVEQSGHSDAELLAVRNAAAQDAASAVSSAAALKAAQFGTKKV